MNNLDIDQTVDYVKNIIDNIRCALCDKLDGCRMRYSCGHAACDNCCINCEDCLICLSPPQTSNAQAKLDNALTQRVKNASVLLETCQDLFNTDVLQRKRISEQLRIEKELFPKCIQAPVKYENKRKSIVLPKSNKENRISNLFPGEETSPYKEDIMENSVSYVQKWLNKNDKEFYRKPFQDLDVNIQSGNNTGLSKKRNTIKKIKDEDVPPVLMKNRKRSHFKTTVKNIPLIDKSRSSLRQYNGTSKRLKQELQPSTNKLQKKCDKDESGIFMDDTIIIDDSQETVFDKDEYAWLAVIEANKKDVTESTSIVNLDYSDVKTLNITSKQTKPISSTPQSNENQITRIPFYKKSYITETCTYCNNIAHKSDEPTKDVEITIDNQMFTTTVKVVKHDDNRSNLFSTSSVAVQTDMCDATQMNYGLAVKERDNKSPDCDDKSIGNTQSEDLFAEEAKYSFGDCKRNETRNCLVIEESDSDTDMEGSGPVPVKVDVHRSCDISEYGILGEVTNIQEHDAMPRRGPRGLTPTSTDSSEKENFNPNRLKRQYSKKKKYVKK